MDTHLEEMLREGMKRQTESVSLPEDLLSRAVGRHHRRKIAVRRLVAGGGAVGVVAVAVGLIFGVVLPQAADQPSPPQVAAGATALVSTTSPANMETAVPVALVLQKTLVATTAAEGEVLHVEISGVDTDGSTFTREVWSTSGTEWKYRCIVEVNGQEQSEISYDSTGLVQDYDTKTNSIVERHDEAIKLKVPSADGGYQEEIQRLLTSGRAAEDGHERIDGRDAVRIIEEMGDGSKNVFLIDAETDTPMEWRIGEFGENRIFHFDVCEKLPGTPENLELLDLKAVYPDATA